MAEERRNAAQKRRKTDENELSAQEARQLIEDLRIHQVELEMQNQELQRAQQEIEESRTKLSDLYDFAPVAYFSLDPGGKIVGLNVTAIDKLKYPRGFLEGNLLRACVDPAFVDELDLYLDSIANELGARPRDLLFVKDGGERFWGRLECTRFHPLKTGGEPIFLCSLVDISDRKSAEQSLAESEEKYRLLVENVQSIIVRSDSEGRVTFINEYGKNLFGYSEEELWYKGVVGTIIPDKLLPKGVLTRVLKRIERHPDQFKGQEMTTVLKNGSEVIISWTVSVLRDQENKTDGFLAIGHDITQRIRLESELRQAQKMEAIGTLAGGIAHDFNNILAAIVGFTEMAIEDLGDSHVNKKLNNVLKSAVRARNLVKQILAFSRKSTHEREVVSLSEIVRETMELLSASIPSTVNTEVVLPDKDDMLTADPIELQQILINLTTNAVHAMRDGGTLRVEVTNVTINSDISKAPQGTANSLSPTPIRPP